MESLGRGAVVVTGASTGIGATCARRLVDEGFTVFAGVRKVEDGERLREERPRGLVPVIIDVVDDESIERARATVSEAVGARGLSGLVNNAGVVVAGPLEFVPLDRFRYQLEVNVVGLLAVTQAFLELLRGGRGRVVNMSSIAGRKVMPFNAPYGASKHAVEALSDALRVELKPWNIEVACIEPGSIKTPIWKKSVALAAALKETYPERADELYGAASDAVRNLVEQVEDRAIPAGKVADAVVHALTARRPKTRYLVGPDAFIQALLKSLLPDRAFDAFIVRAMKLPS